MGNSIKVSVIIPVYNAEEYLIQCIESVVNQTLNDIEIICVDAGSTDNSVKVLRDYTSKDDRIKLITDKGRLGAGAARNIGLDLARGEYLSFLDADDFFETDMLEKAYLQSINNNADITVFGCDVFENKKNRFVPCNYSIDYSLLPRNNPFNAADVKQDVFKIFVGWAWDKLFRTDFIKENNTLFQAQRTTNDMLFVFSALVKANKVFVFGDVLAHHRQEQGSLSVTRERSWHCFYDALMELKKYLVDEDLYTRFERDYINYCLHFSIWNLNTLQEPSKTFLYNKLREEWFCQLGVMGYPKQFFYNKYEYLLFKNICKNSAEYKLKIKDIFLLKFMKTRITFSKFITSIKYHGVAYTIKMFKSKF